MDHACLILDAPLFSGIEQEGPRKGQRTLFVKGKETVKVVDVKLYAANHDQIYFGSGRISPIDWDLAHWVMENTALDVAFEVGCVSDAQKAFFKYATPQRNKRVLLICTPIMYLPDGTQYHKDMSLMAWASGGITLDTVVMKIDTGHSVTILGKDKVWTNDFSAGYADDKILPLISGDANE